MQRDGVIILPSTDELDELVAGGSDDDPIKSGGKLDKLTNQLEDMME